MQPLRRHLGLIAAITLLAAVATGVFAALRPSSYRSHADLLVATGFLTGAYGPQVKPPFQTQAQVLVTQAKLASEPAVAARASQLLHGRFAPAQIRSAVTLSASPNLNIMTVTATAEKAADAVAIANASARAVAERARAQAQHEIQVAASSVAAALALDPPAPRRAQLLAQQRKLELLAAGTDGGVQVTQAAVEATDANVSALIVIALGALSGLVLGCLAALGVDRLEHHVDEAEVAERFGAPALGRLRREPDPQDERGLALALDDVAARALAKVIVVVGTGKGTPAAVAAGRIAVGLGETGRRVVVVDAEMRRPTLHTANGLPLEPGLAEAVEGEIYDIGAALHGLPIADGSRGSVRLLAAGTPAAPDPTLLLTGPSLGETLDVLEPLGEFLVIAAPDALETPDAKLLARRAHGIVLAVTDPGTRTATLARLHDTYGSDRTPILGIVFVDADTPLPQR